MNLITKDGLFSKIDNNFIHIGDGETVELSIEMAEPMSDYSITNFSIKKLSTSSPDISQTSLLSGNGVKTGKVLINASGTNFVNKEYFIPIWYYPITTKIYSKYNTNSYTTYEGKPTQNYGEGGSFENNLFPGQPFIMSSGSLNYDLIYKGRPTYASPLSGSGFLYYIPSSGRYTFLNFTYNYCFGGDVMFLPAGDELAINPFMNGTPGVQINVPGSIIDNTGLVSDELVTLYYYTDGTMKSLAELRPENWAWKKVHPNIVNTRMSINDYRSSPFYWNKATNSTTNFLPATLVDDDDVTLLSSENNYMLQIHYLHFGQIKMIEIPIYIDVRNCNITLN